MRLQGKTLVTTHPADSDDRLVGALRDAGAKVLECPSIRIAPPEDLAALEEKVASLKDYDWVLFTSKNALEAVVDVLKTRGWGAGKLSDCKIAVVGRATASRLSRLGLKPDLVPTDYSAQGLAEALEKTEQVAGKRFLFPCSEIARDTLGTALENLGGRVDRVVAYRTVTSTETWPDLDLLKRQNPDGVFFASSSAVAGFRERLGARDSGKILKETLCLSIGRQTTATLRDQGAVRIAEAATSDFDGLLQLALHELRVARG